MKHKFSVQYPDGTGPKKVPERSPVVQEAIAASKEHPVAQKPEKVITLPLYGIRISDKDGEVTVVSCLKATNPFNAYIPNPETGYEKDNDQYLIWNAKMVAIEDMIKYHYKAGVKIWGKKYVKGLEDYIDYMKVYGR